MSKQKTIHQPRQRRYPTFWQQWVGKLAIRILPAHTYYQPDVVFITRVTRFGLLAGDMFTSNETPLIDPWKRRGDL